MRTVKNYKTLWYKIKVRMVVLFAHWLSFRYGEKGQRRQKRRELRHYFRQQFGVECRPVAYGDKYIYSGQAGSDIMLQELQKGEPCFVGRFGIAEPRAVVTFINSKKNIVRFPEKQRSSLSVNAGFFPATDDNLARYASEFIEHVQHIDILGAFCRDDEKYIWDLYCSHAKPIALDFSYVFKLDSPWTQHLQGKKVLVISPFAELIEEQYQKRELLYKNPLVLPEFELVTIKAVQSNAYNHETLPFKDWFEALDSMYAEINKVDFDIALIGAGAYGLSLGAYCKKKGKQVVIMGGMLQVLFGIYGQRWEKSLTNEGILNEHWVRPRPQDRPKGYEVVEHGCYW